MITILILICAVGTDPATCTPSTALEVRTIHAWPTECANASLITAAADPRGGRPEFYVKTICGRQNAEH